jgi:erythromycin esterase-like protein
MTHPRSAIYALLAVLVTLPSTSSATCNPEIALAQVVLEQKVVVLGELHGTQETPRFAGEYACVLANGPQDVVLALEIPEVEQSRISTYIESQGSLVDFSALVQGDFWNRPEHRQDGRSSGAMGQLIERVRQLRREGRRLSIIAIDGQRGSLKRDAAMAKIIRDLLQAKPLTKVIALVGNVHALKDRGAFFEKDYESLAFLLSDLLPLTLNVLPKRGYAWVCIEVCGSKRITPQAWLAGRSPGMYIGEGPDAVPRYHGTIVLEEARASPPARTR